MPQSHLITCVEHFINLSEARNYAERDDHGTSCVLTRHGLSNFKMHDPDIHTNLCLLLTVVEGLRVARLLFHGAALTHPQYGQTPYTQGLPFTHPCKSRVQADVTLTATYRYSRRLRVILILIPTGSWLRTC